MKQSKLSVYELNNHLVKLAFSSTPFEFSTITSCNKHCLAEFNTSDKLQDHLVDMYSGSDESDYEEVQTVEDEIQDIMVNRQ